MRALLLAFAALLVLPVAASAQVRVLPLDTIGDRAG